jgi:hypothetical protein
MFVGGYWAMFLAVVVAVVFVSVPLICGWRALDQSIQKTIPGSESMLAASGNGGVDALLLSDVSDDATEDDDTLHQLVVLGILCFLVLLLRIRSLWLTDREGSPGPYYFLYHSILERPG